MSNKDTSSLIAQRNIRVAKVAKLRQLGIDPYPSKVFRDTFVNRVIQDYDNLQGKKVTVAGRVMAFRHHGHLLFMTIQDQSGRVQIYIKDDIIKESDASRGYLSFDQIIEFIDVGDIIEVAGIVTKTKRGEISVMPGYVRILTKSLRPLPDKHKGLQDEELLVRQRYLDMIMHPEKRKRFEYGAKIKFAIRQFLNDRGFLEIKTPILQPVYGGATAKPFMSHVNALDLDFFLSVSHELYLKRLITAGFENVYNIVGYFRNEGIDRSHNPEFEMLETMSAFHNYEYNMQLMEELYKYIATKVFGKTVFKVRGQEVDFGKEWERLPMIDAVRRYAKIDFDTVKSIEEAHKVLDDIGYQEEKPKSIGECMVKVFEEKVEDQLIQPVFITGHPVEISPLAKKMSSDPRFVERFEIFIGGIEQGDNWTELNDPQELFERFKDQVKKREEGDAEAHPMDIDFIETLEYGMPPTTGVGPGIERMIMTMTETDYIDDVLFFPMIKPKPISKQQKEIYGEENLTVKSKKNPDSLSEFKFVTLLNKELSGWKVTNTVAHINAYLASAVPKNMLPDGHFVETDDGVEIPLQLQTPCVSLTASDVQLHNLARKLLTGFDGVLKFLIYTEDMVTANSMEKLHKLTSSKNFDDITVYGIGLFGKIKDLDKITKKFSLFK